jgi:adenylate cyclase
LGVIDPERNIYSLGQARFDPLTGQEGVYGAGETGGYQILINYRGELDDFQHISLREVLAGEIPPGFMTDRIVMIGAIAPSLNDLRPTVYNSTLLRSTELMPGVVIHANLTSQILQSALEGRPMLRASHKMWNQLLVVVWSFYSAILGTCYVQNSRLTWFSALVAAIAIPTSAYLAFLWGWLIPIFTPLLAVMSAGSISVRVTLWTQLKLSYRELSHQHQLLQEAHLQLHKTNESYGRFVPFEYLEFLEKDNILEVELGDHVTKAMAIMFSDIRFFTTLSEDMTPQQTFDFVNTYLQTVTPAICTYQGLVVKFLGDGIMAVFPQGANDAVAAGIAQQVKIRDYNKHQIKTQQIPIRVGIGIHIGRIMVGIIGEASRVQVDTLSDNVNLAARLEGLTKFYGVSLLISESVLQALHQPEQYQIRFLDQAIVKGKNEPISVYEVLDAEPQKIRDLKQATQTEFDQGLQAYRHQAFGAAIVHFNQVLKVNPLDKTARLYLERIEILQQQEIPKNWDGVWRFTQK